MLDSQAVHSVFHLPRGHSRLQEARSGLFLTVNHWHRHPIRNQLQDKNKKNRSDLQKPFFCFKSDLQVYLRCWQKRLS